MEVYFSYLPLSPKKQHHDGLGGSAYGKAIELEINAHSSVVHSRSDMLFLFLVLISYLQFKNGLEKNNILG